jgi:ankyrin repeat protein
MSKSLPAQPSLRQLKIQAKDWAQALKEGRPEALTRYTEALGRAAGSEPRLHDAQLALAREYGFANWAALKEEVERRENEALEPALGQFRDAVRTGNVAALEILLEAHPALKSKLNEPFFDFGKPAILQAVVLKNRPMIEALLRAGADINRRSQWGPGGFGVLDNVDEELGEYLIAQGAQVDVHAAAALGKVDRLRRLLDEDAALINARGGDGGTPLHFAKNLETTELLLQRGADVTLRDMDHQSTAAMWQITHRENLYRLIEAGAPIDIFMACVHGDRALAERALREDPDCLGAFVSFEKGFGKFAPDTGGNIYCWRIGHAARPLPVAAKYGHMALVDYLLGLARPADRLIALCHMEDSEKVEALLRTEPGLVENLTPNESRALPDAIHFGHLAAARLMLAAGFPVMARGLGGASVLHEACWFGQPDLVQSAIERGAPLEDTSNGFQSTPLEGACHGSLHCWSREKGDYVGVVNALIRAGAKTEKLREKKSSGATGWAAPSVMELFG